MKRSRHWATKEQHVFAREVEHLWRELARKCGNPYLASTHLRAVHELAIDATRWATESQVLATIRANLDRDSAPIRIPEWARLWAADESEGDHRERKRAEREPLDPGVARAMGEMVRPVRHNPNDHGFENDGSGTDTCRRCGGPPGVHVHKIEERFAAMKAARRATRKEAQIECPECEAWATPGHECLTCGTFLTIGQGDDEYHAMAATLKLWRQADAEKPLHQIGETPAP